MTKKKPLDLERLRRLLRDGDPVSDGFAPDSLALDRMRRRMLTEADRDRDPVGVGLPARALTATAVVLLTALLGWSLWHEDSVVPPSSGPAGPTLHRVAEPGGQEATVDSGARQIHFSTPGGTRVVWTLDPDFEV